MILKYAVIPFIIFVCMAFYKYFPWIPQDNPIEEKIEDVFLSRTGIDIDLSPDSKESSDKRDKDGISK